MSDHPVMHWDRSDMVEEIAGTLVVEGFYDLPVGTMRVLPYVSHVAQADFAWAEPPRVAAAIGAAVMLDLVALDGAGFGLVVLRTTSAGYGDEYSSGDLTISWTRKGGLQ